MRLWLAAWLGCAVPAAASSKCANLYAQCGGGPDFKGPKCCAHGTCQKQAYWYSQCLPQPSPTPTKKATHAPSKKPSHKPTQRPTHKPTHRPSAKPSHRPTAAPTELCKNLVHHQCGGKDFHGEKCCRPDAHCKAMSPSHSECVLKPPTPAPTHSPTYKPSPKPTLRGTAKSTTKGQGQEGSCNVFPSAPQPGFQITLYNRNCSYTALDDAMRKAAARWEKIVVGDLPDRPHSSQGQNWFMYDTLGRYSGFVDDVIVSYGLLAIDGKGGQLSLGSNVMYREAPAGKPTTISGFVDVDVDDVEDLLATGQLLNALTHELGHVLGIGTAWDINGARCSVCTPWSSSTDFDYHCQAAQTKYKAAGFGGALLLANTGGPGAECVHWNEDIMTTELMTSILPGGKTLSPISAITAASLEDLGYTVDYAACDPFHLKTANVNARAALPAASEASAAPSSGGAAAAAEDGDLKDGDLTYVPGSGKAYRMVAHGGRARGIEPMGG